MVAASYLLTVVPGSSGVAVTVVGPIGPIGLASADVDVRRRVSARPRGKLEFDRRWLPVGGALSGFFGGLSGHQGALRAAFLIRSGLDKQGYVGTAALCSMFVDLTRLTVYFAGATFFSKEFGSAFDMGAAPLVLAACAAAARGVIQSDFSPIYVAAVPAGDGTADPDRGKFKIVVGFEGFSNIVDYQIEKCSALLTKRKLQALEHGDYPVLEGRFSEIYEHIAPSPFIYRANFPLDRMAEFVRQLDGSLSKAAVFLDFGCGRFLCGTDDLSDDQWMHICDLAARHDGYGLLEKAPDEFKKRKVEVVAVSIDSQFSHHAWRNTPVNKGGIGEVKFPMVADVKHEIAQAYGIEFADAGVALRASFLIDKKGVVQHQVVNNLPLGRNVDEMLRLVDALQFHEKNGEVCPAGWQKGEDGMTATADGVADYLSSHSEEL